MKTQKQKEKILKKILENNKYNLEIYWNYDDALSEEQIIKILSQEDGLNEIENELYDYNIAYISEQIEQIIKEELSEEDAQDDDLKEFLRENIQDHYNFNLKGILKNSSIRIRLELNTNEDAFYLGNRENNDFKKANYYKDIRNIFKTSILAKDLNKEIYNFIGSDYCKLVFFFKLTGENILTFREQFLKNKLELREGLSCGLFNSWAGCGSDLDLKLKHKVILNLNNWTQNDENKVYYDVSVLSDNLSKYGINEVYGLVGDCWEEW